MLLEFCVCVPRMVCFSTFMPLSWLCLVTAAFPGDLHFCLYLEAYKQPGAFATIRLCCTRFVYTPFDIAK